MANLIITRKCVYKIVISAGKHFCSTLISYERATVYEIFILDMAVRQLIMSMILFIKQNNFVNFIKTESFAISLGLVANPHSPVFIYLVFCCHCDHPFF